MFQKPLALILIGGSLFIGVPDVASARRQLPTLSWLGLLLAAWLLLARKP